MEPKRSRLAPQIVFFWKPTEPYGWLSNWSNHSFYDGSTNFKTSEHYVMYHKALTMNDMHSAQLILDAKTPKDAKAIGRNIANWDEEKWVQAREDIMLRALSLKIKTHVALKYKLVQTCGKILAEASPYDTIWGIGCSKTDTRVNEQDLWPGQNLLGKTWMKVREMTLNEV